METALTEMMGPSSRALRAKMAASKGLGPLTLPTSCASSSSSSSVKVASPTFHTSLSSSASMSNLWARPALACRRCCRPAKKPPTAATPVKGLRGPWSAPPFEGTSRASVISFPPVAAPPTNP